MILIEYINNNLNVSLGTYDNKNFNKIDQDIKIDLPHNRFFDGDILDSNFNILLSKYDKYLTLDSSKDLKFIFDFIV